MRQAGAVVKIYAHRGYAAREPEMTWASYRAAIDWAEHASQPLGLECDVHYSGDGHLICLHDLTVDRTSTGHGRAYERTLTELRALDFGSWRTGRPSPDQERLITLAELIELTANARARGVDVSLAIETKHPNPRGTEVEDGVAALLEPYGWTAPGSPVRIISFSLAGLERAGELMPDVPRTFLIEKDFGEWSDGHLPEGITTVGPDYELLLQQPDYLARALAHGHQIDVWNPNTPSEVTWCLDRGVTGITTDDPAMAARTIARWSKQHSGIA